MTTRNSATFAVSLMMTDRGAENWLENGKGLVATQQAWCIVKWRPTRRSCSSWKSGRQSCCLITWSWRNSVCFSTTSAARWVVWSHRAVLTRQVIVILGDSVQSAARCVVRSHRAVLTRQVIVILGDSVQSAARCVVWSHRAVLTHQVIVIQGDSVQSAARCVVWSHRAVLTHQVIVTLGDSVQSAARCLVWCHRAVLTRHVIVILGDLVLNIARWIVWSLRAALACQVIVLVGDSGLSAARWVVWSHRGGMGCSCPLFVDQMNSDRDDRGGGGGGEMSFVMFILTVDQMNGDRDVGDGVCVGGRGGDLICDVHPHCLFVCWSDERWQGWWRWKQQRHDARPWGDGAVSRWQRWADHTYTNTYSVATGKWSVPPDKSPKCDGCELILFPFRNI